MKKVILSLLAMAILSACGVYVDIYSDYDKTTDFTRYKTFAWLPDKDNANNEYDNAIIRNNIKNYFTHEFIDNYGFIADTDLPDVLIEFQVTKIAKVKTEEHAVQQQQTAPVYNTYPYNNNPYNNNPYQQNPYYTPQPNPYNYNGYNSNYNYQTRYIKEQHNYTQSSITINMIDNKSNQLVWTATASADIYDNNTLVINNDIHPAIHRILKYFPAKKMKNKKSETNHKNNHQNKTTKNN